jgi:hypothetical protein
MLLDQCRELPALSQRELADVDMVATGDAGEPGVHSAGTMTLLLPERIDPIVDRDAGPVDAPVAGHAQSTQNYWRGDFVDEIDSARNSYILAGLTLKTYEESRPEHWHIDRRRAPILERPGVALQEYGAG